MAKETVVAYETNWDELNDVVGDTLGKLGFGQDFSISPKSVGFAAWKDPISPQVLVGTWEATHVSFVAGITVSQSSVNLDDSVSVWLERKHPLIDNAHLTQEVFLLKNPAIVRPGERIRIWYKCKESKTIRITLHYYDFYEIAYKIPPDKAKELLRPPDPPAPPDDTRHHNTPIPPFHKRITFSFVKGTKQSFWFEHCNELGIWQPKQYLSLGQSITIALDEKGRLNWGTAGSYDKRWFLDKKGNELSRIPNVPKHNDIFEIYMEDWT